MNKLYIIYYIHFSNSICKIRSCNVGVGGLDNIDYIYILTTIMRCINNYSLVHHNSCFRFITKIKLRESESLVFSVYALCMLFVNIPFFFLIFNFFGLHILFILCVLKRMEFCSFLRVGIRRFLISIIDCILPDVDLNASSVQIFLISITLECRTSGGGSRCIQRRVPRKWVPNKEKWVGVGMGVGLIDLPKSSWPWLQLHSIPVVATRWELSGEVLICLESSRLLNQWWHSMSTPGCHYSLKYLTHNVPDLLVIYEIKSSLDTRKDSVLDLYAKCIWFNKKVAAIIIWNLKFEIAGRCRSKVIVILLLNLFV